MSPRQDAYGRMNKNTQRIPRSRKKRYVLRRFRVEVYQNGKLVDEVKRTLIVQRSNSFVIKYDGKRYTAQSKAGDLSDPLERDDSFLDSLFIEIGADNYVLSP